MLLARPRDDNECGQCKAAAKDVQILTAKCGHQRICAECLPHYIQVESRGSGLVDCPTCRQKLEEEDFSAKTPEDLDMERKIQVRRQVKQVYNKFESEFADARGYNDYLEKVEDLIWNLTYNNDVLRTKEEMDAYTQENREAIARNRRKRDEERAAWKKRVDDENEAMERKRGEWDDQEHQMKRDKQAAHLQRLHKLKAKRKDLGSVGDGQSNGAPLSPANENLPPGGQQQHLVAGQPSQMQAAPQYILRIVDVPHDSKGNRRRRLWPDFERKRRAEEAAARDRAESEAGLFIVRQGKRPKVGDVGKSSGKLR